MFQICFLPGGPNDQDPLQREFTILYDGLSALITSFITYGLCSLQGEEEGYWLSYEEPETAAYKAAYAKGKLLGGVAIVDMSLDDARGACDGTKFPILRSAKMNL